MVTSPNDYHQKLGEKIKEFHNAGEDFFSADNIETISQQYKALNCSNGSNSCNSIGSCSSK